MDEATIFNTVMQIYNAERFRPENATKSSADLLAEAKTLVTDAVNYAKTAAAAEPTV